MQSAFHRNVALASPRSQHLRRNLIKTFHIYLWPSLALLAAFLAAPRPAWAHGFAGPRFFPATLTTDDPFVADELSLPTISTIRSPEEGGTRETEISFDLAKRITPRLAIEIGQGLTLLDRHEGGSTSGFGNLEVGAKYELLKSPTHEAILSVGVDAEIGGTGSDAVEADSFTTWTPAVFFGKGFGDLPEGVRFLKPFALTGLLGVAIPSRASTRRTMADELTGLQSIEVERHPATLEWGFALEYSLIYLQSQVKDLHLHAPFDRLVPLVEVALQTPLNREGQGQTSGTINPGVIWSGQHFQIGVEAMVPINDRSGDNVGVIAQLHFYLDDLFPHSLGRPIFGGGR